MLQGFKIDYPDSTGEEILLHDGITGVVTEWGLNSSGERLPRRLRVTFQPGAIWPGSDVHHASREHVTVLDGVLQDEGGAYPPETFIEAEQGSQHIPFSEAGCTLRAVFPDLQPCP